ncbi:MAG: ABC transporter ATP-binding protein [Devosia sp. 67-54]|uniref:oligopeptide/dipeptide ABC transporter ATP-binding protein n=1 Tax=unclassified Devosia TaxID=196773 RepID=UPI00086877C1|nr:MULTISPECIES: oligopeptide/dipeptide ABC transporter ATP-binding protein [unclassified Devosia]MBN9306034.1 ATP-binding cassette domain-containing protein [Devosia sp.]ODU54167.1 MAG: oligopeptide transporter ATP-binding component [Acetobacteraceae bacterium SCN 69-10]OJX16292.1 MAG: ABC transporter ATP-binding protein [Devosia sp. 67-54]
MPLLEVKDLSIGFHMPGRDVQVVNKVSFALEQGETLAIVGESGSGKTQTAFSLIGLLAQNGFSSGSVLFEGQEILGLPEAKLNKVRAEKIAMIFQDPMTSLNPYIRVGEQLVEVLVLHKSMTRAAAQAEAIRMLDAVKLPDARNIFTRFPHECSGGMRQRIMIAMALLCRPKLLIADEPTTALDVTVQAQMLELFKSLTAEFGTALIIITHDLGVVAGLADRMLVMYAGRAVETGAVDELFYDPRHPYTLGLLNSTPNVEEKTERLNSISGSPPNLEHLPRGCAFHPRCAFRFERCFSEVPQLLEFGEGSRRKACHYARALVAEESAA